LPITDTPLTAVIDAASSAQREQKRVGHDLTEVKLSFNGDDRFS